MFDDVGERLARKVIRSGWFDPRLDADLVENISNILDENETSLGSESPVDRTDLAPKNAVDRYT